MELYSHSLSLPGYQVLRCFYFEATLCQNSFTVLYSFHEHLLSKASNKHHFFFKYKVFSVAMSQPRTTLRSIALVVFLSCSWIFFLAALENGHPPLQVWCICAWRSDIKQPRAGRSMSNDCFFSLIYRLDIDWIVV